MRFAPRVVSSGSRKLLIPRGKIFFQLLEEESKNALAGAVQFSELIQNFDHLADKRDKIKNIEHHSRGDHGSRFNPQTVSGEMGSCSQNSLRLGAHDSRRRGRNSWSIIRSSEPRGSPL